MRSELRAGFGGRCEEGEVGGRGDWGMAGGLG